MARRRRKPISSEPLVNFVHLHFEAIVLCAVTGVIAYATCLPGPEPLTAIGRGALDGTHLVSKRDVIQNVILYLPFGFLVALILRRKSVSWWTTVVGALVFAALVSYISEFSQRYLPQRISSTQDVLFNITGAVAGAIGAFLFRTGTGGFRSVLRDGLTHYPLFQSVVLVATLYVIVIGLSLAATGTSTIDNAGSRWFRPDMIVLLTGWLCASVLSAAGSYALHNELGFTKLAASAITLWMSILWVGSTATIALLVQQQTAPILQSALIMTAAPAGVIIACLLPARNRPLQWIQTWAGPALLCCVGMIVIRELSPFEFVFSADILSQHLGSISLVPFKTYFHMNSPVRASSDVAEKFFRYAALGALLGTALRIQFRTLLSKQLSAGVWLTLLLSGALEAAQIACPRRNPDITHVLLALAACTAGIIFQQWWFDLIASAQPRRQRKTAHNMPSSPSPNRCPTTC